MRFRPGVQNPPQWRHAIGGENVRVAGVPGIQNAVYVEEQDVELHTGSDVFGMKPQVRLCCGNGGRILRQWGCVGHALNCELAIEWCQGRAATFE